MMNKIIAGLGEASSELNIFQHACLTTAVYPGAHTSVGLTYTIVGMGGEAGETLNKLKKMLRGDPQFSPEALQQEIEDTIWYAMAALDELGVPFSEAAANLLNRLHARQQAQTIRGDGDNR